MGVINDAVAGCSIDMFDEDKSKSYLSTTADWLKNIYVYMKIIHIMH